MKVFTVRLSIFVLVLIFLQILVSALFPADIPQEVLLVDEYITDEVDIIYFGDSTVSYPVGEVTTAEILQEMLPNYTIGEVSHPAYSMDVYLRYAKYLVHSGYRPRAVIIPVNMRSFSPEWDLRPGYQFEKESRILTYGLFLSRIFLRPLEILGALAPEISQDTFLNATVYNGDTPVGTVADFEELGGSASSERAGGGGFVYHDALPSEDDAEALQKTLIYYYMHGLKENHRKLQAMLETAELLTENDIDVIFYITPINYERGEKYLSSTFSERFVENTDLVKSLLTEDRLPNLSVLNFVFGLEAYAFVDMEHLRETGKTYVAEQLAAALQPELSVASSDTDSEMTSSMPLADPSLTKLRQTPALEQSHEDKILEFLLTSLDPDGVFDRFTPSQRKQNQESWYDAIALAPTPTDPSPLPSMAESAQTAPETQGPMSSVVAPSNNRRDDHNLPAAETQEPMNSPVASADLTPAPVEASPPETVASPAPIEPSSAVTASEQPVATTKETQEPLASDVATPTPIEPSSTSVADDRVPGTVINAEFLAHLEPYGDYPVDVYRLRYQSLDENGQQTEVRADIYLPSVEKVTPFPVLVYGAGTTGISNVCAPLDEQPAERNWGNYQSHLLAYAAQGYIAILPNWLGFDNPGHTHPYFVAELQANAMLDAARAVYNFFDHVPTGDVLARPTEAVFFAGYSSGGHAAFAAKDFAASYAPELPIKGIIGFGPTTNVETLLRENPVFSPYVIYAYNKFYGGQVIDPSDVFLSNWVATFDADVINKCVDSIFVYYSHGARSLYSPEFRTALYSDQLSEAFPQFAEKLEANYSGVAGGTNIPVLILQGTADTVVTPPSQERFLGELCELGNRVTYLEYPALSHSEVRWASFRDTVSWMQHVVEGDTPTSKCADLNLSS